MEYRNRLKGALTQSLLKCLLTDAAYRIVPLGVEEIIREVTVLEREKYLQLGLPAILREIPDFFVADASMGSYWLVEVKYRRAWNQQTRNFLQNDLHSQVRDWGPLCVILFLGSPAKTHYPGQEKQPSSWIGAFVLHDTPDGLMVRNPGYPETPWSDVDWSIGRVQDVFTALKEKDKWSARTIEQTSLMVKNLKKLDIFD